MSYINFKIRVQFSCSNNKRNKPINIDNILEDLKTKFFFNWLLEILIHISSYGEKMYIH